MVVSEKIPKFVGEKRGRSVRGEMYYIVIILLVLLVLVVQLHNIIKVISVLQSKTTITTSTFPFVILIIKDTLKSTFIITITTDITRI